MNGDSLTAALARVQAALPVIPKSNTAVVEKRSGGSYSYAFADLATITREVLPRLAAVGLAWTCGPTLDDGRFVLRWELRHTSGESVSGRYPLPAAGSPQELGSAITYGRRYCLTSVVGVAPEDDDDGAAAAGQPRAAARRTTARRADPPDGRRDRTRPPAAAARRRVDQAGEVPELASPMQLRRLAATFDAAGISERPERVAFASGVIERDVVSADELTAVEVAKVMAALTVTDRAADDDDDDPQPADEEEGDR